MRAFFRYPGSKWGLANWIISHFPADYEKMVYLEPFVGSGAVFFNKRPGRVETINDLDGDIVNLFKVLRECPDKLERQLTLTPYSRQEYEMSFQPCEDPLERARRYMVRTSQSIGDKCGGSGWRNHKQPKIGGTACAWGYITESLGVVSRRLRGSTTNLVQIENTDAFRLIERYNSKDVLMYLDPPYVLGSRKGGKLYRYELEDEAHQRLLDLITRSRAKILISGYPSEQYDRLLAGWYMDMTWSQTTSAEKAKEIIWMNYQPPFLQLSLDAQQ